MRNRTKLLITLLLLGLAAACVGLATFPAFSSTTANAGNRFAAGSVTLADNDTGSAMYNVTNQAPNVNTVACITVSYTGSLDADVALYTSTTTIPVAAQNISLTIEKGTATGATFPGCGSYTAQSTIYSGSLYDFQQTRGSYAAGIVSYPGAATKWVTSDSLVYRFTLYANDSAGGADSGTHQFTWEARNQ